MTAALGPAWTVRPDTPDDTGRQPLAVETVIGGHAAALIPGVITTTPHARYLALHARLAIEAQRRGWTEAQDLRHFRGLVRRAEVVLGAVSVAHDGEGGEHRVRAGSIGVHGVNTLGREVGRLGNVDVGQVAGAYSGVPGGYLPTYGGIEAVLGLTDGRPLPTPGPAADIEQLSALDEVLDLAERAPTLSTADLRALRHLCVCGIGDAPDGQCVRRAYFGGGSGYARTHRLSASLLVGALAGQQAGPSIDTFMDRWCCFRPGMRDLLDDELYTHALLWRGGLLRNWFVWAWRLIWARLVSPLTNTGTLEEAIAAFVRDLPDATVRQALVDDLPLLVDAVGTPLPVEHDLYRERLEADRWSVLGMLRLLAVGARRLDHLDPVSRDAFVGSVPDDLGPAYVAAWLARDADRRLADAVSDLAAMLFQRAESVSRQKMQWTRYGLRLPTRLRRVGDRWRLEGREGSGAVSLRLPTFTSVMRQLGVLARDGETWAAGRYAAEVMS
ncbi:hypothetical protein GA0074696_3332 [Micromonospora purpureochromogenes]|uniref:Uncharacterized protein n=1 Tax=Micromonospora purpureochromogenes TaxID=47872 RepID=A0A1C4YFA7_9ACTN|nr:hypothetical protein [Micromonospora purpureochromogenes]SCF19398.1 hypothetical protein GA0074696_3332 [Micromonospora purpureochromogenes]